MTFLLFSFLAAYWFQLETRQFPEKINKQLYQDMESLMPLPFSLADFFSQSTLQPKQAIFTVFFYFLFPFFTLIFSHQNIAVILILCILSYLSIIDYLYYLTDIKYIAIIFLLTISHLLFVEPFSVYEKLLSLFYLLLFLFLFTSLLHWFYKKEVFGLGDVALLLALAPLFQLEQLLLLLFLASTLGVLFYLFYWQIKKEKLIKLPFIPFISFSTFILLWLNY